MRPYQSEHYHKAAGHRSPGSRSGSWFVCRCPTVPPQSYLVSSCCLASRSPPRCPRGLRRHPGYPISSPGRGPRACPPPCCLWRGPAWRLNATAGTWQRFRCYCRCCACGASAGRRWFETWIWRSATAPGTFPGTDQGWLEVRKDTVQSNLEQSAGKWPSRRKKETTVNLWKLYSIPCFSNRKITKHLHVCPSSSAQGPIKKQTICLINMWSVLCVFTGGSLTAGLAAYHGRHLEEQLATACYAKQALIWCTQTHLHQYDTFLAFFTSPDFNEPFYSLDVYKARPRL